MCEDVAGNASLYQISHDHVPTVYYPPSINHNFLLDYDFLLFLAIPELSIILTCIHMHAALLLSCEI